MTGDDIYDLAAWCPLCDATHDPCEPVGEWLCIVCGDLLDPDVDDLYCPKHRRSS
jgi:hypothetical protein